MRRLALIAALVMVAGSAAALDPAGPYKLDGKGNCHAASGKFVKKTLCAAPAAPTRCRDAKGKFAKCSAPGAKPA